MIDLIFCNWPPYCCATPEGWLIGTNSVEGVRCPKHKYEYVDWAYGYRNLRRLEKHIVLVKSLKPRYACVPDVMDKWSFTVAMLIAKKLSSWTQNIIIPIHNNEMLSLIPEDYIIGYPMPSSYSPEPDLSFPILRTRKVHLLGGSPKKQKEISTRFPHLISADGNMISKMANKLGMVWINGGWEKMEGESTEIIRESLTNVRNMWMN